MRKTVAIVLCMLAAGFVWHAFHDGGNTILLWPGGAPRAAGNEPQDQPKLYIFLPPKATATGAAVIVCPGGGYTRLALSHEGRDVARWLNSLGIAAFVLEYRLAPRYRYPAPIEDALRALRFVRYHRAEYGLASNRIGIIGFSAGGHIAALAAEGKALIFPADGVDAVSSRPDFVMLGYPVITMLAPHANEGSVSNLLGKAATETQRRMVSAELGVTSLLPPIFIFLSGDDKIVDPENSLLFYQALQKAKVPVELHIFAHGKHGFGLADGQDGTPYNPALAVWAHFAERWMRSLGIFNISSEISKG